MAECACCRAPLQIALGLHRPPPSGKVVRRRQGVGAGPHRPGHHSPWDLVDGCLPSHVLLLLGHQVQHFALEGELASRFDAPLPVQDLSQFMHFLEIFGQKSAFLGQKQCFLGKKCTITW